MFKKIFWILAIGTVLVQGDTLYDTDNYDGWIPIANENVFNARIPEHPPHTNYVISETHSEGNEDEFITIVAPQSVQTKEDYFSQPEISRNLKIENNFECNINGVTVCPEEMEHTKTEIQNTLPTQFINPNETARRARKLDGSDLISKTSTTNDSTDIVVKGEEFTTTKNYNKYEASNETIRKVYEVTENPEPVDVKAENTEALGYIYDPPKTFHSPNKSSYVDLLSKTLLKYNINENDRLQNYALSKQNSNRNILMPKPMNVPRAYNSWNHLLVDPLLAVFLSNYGRYLPGVYGVEGNYKNLYGYLASNNIHNNRPFGLYKINSDTDSSSFI